MHQLGLRSWLAGISMLLILSCNEIVQLNTEFQIGNTGAFCTSGAYEFKITTSDWSRKYLLEEDETKCYAVYIELGDDILIEVFDVENGGTLLASEVYSATDFVDDNINVLLIAYDTCRGDEELITQLIISTGFNCS